LTGIGTSKADHIDGDSAIIARDLRKRYGELQAVDGMSFDVRRGEIFGMLGPNGAGKTTTVEILEGMRRADSGSAIVNGYDVATDVKAAPRSSISSPIAMERAWTLGPPSTEWDSPKRRPRSTRRSRAARSSGSRSPWPW
jgi:ABC-type uncharacterized transport system ATPase subunit